MALTKRNKTQFHAMDTKFLRGIEGKQVWIELKMKSLLEKLDYRIELGEE
jgi:hypothetical protein